MVDVLRGELARRYRDGTAQVSQLSRVLIVDDDPAIRRVVSALLDLDEHGLLEAVKRLTDG